MAKKRISGTEQLFGETEAITTVFARQQEGTQKLVPIENLVPNRFNPRRCYSKEGLRELVHSIETFGFIGALDGRSLPDGRVELAYGSRRLLAAKTANMRRIPVLLHSWDDDQMRLITLVENLSQTQLTLADEADAISYLNHELSVTVQEISTMLRKPRGWVQGRLALHEAPEDVKQMVAENSATLGSARFVARIQDEVARLTLRDRVLQQRLSPIQVQLAVQEIERGHSVNDALKSAGFAKRAGTRAEAHQSRIVFPIAEAVIAIAGSEQPSELCTSGPTDSVSGETPSTPVRARKDSGGEWPTQHTRQTQAHSAPLPRSGLQDSRAENGSASQHTYDGISDNSSDSIQLLSLAVDALDNFDPRSICAMDTKRIQDFLGRIEGRASALRDELTKG